MKPSARPSAARQAAQDAADAPLIAKLIECERCNDVEYHVKCKQWHHRKVPCNEAHLYQATREPPAKEHLTGTMYIAGTGAFKGERAEWPHLQMHPPECKCLPKHHPRYWAHCSGQHVPGETVIAESAHRELCRLNGIKL